MSTGFEGFAQKVLVFLYFLGKWGFCPKSWFSPESIGSVGKAHAVRSADRLQGFTPLPVLAHLDREDWHPARESSFFQQEGVECDEGANGTSLHTHQARTATQEQIAIYLESAGEQAESLREALRQDADLRELATTPLMLTILLFAYKGTSPDKISELTSLEAKQEQIFAFYVQHMLKRRGVSKRYKPEQITHWLTYLARQMNRIVSPQKY